MTRSRNLLLAGAVVAVGITAVAQAGIYSFSVTEGLTNGGIAVYENGSAIGTTTTGPTSAVIESVVVPTTGDITL
ncbi:hypothetical protein SAMN05421828_11540 [Acidiphilium rubrum]|uniref:Uncharacterized protein n=1 Tax=Acidiphilium rubrum TaxID=526 RepID=A0A8G2CLU1_ACIRU|nr:hypothetical protein SAMN05421828_11540 [Acidiphilium rubrum]